MKKEETAPMEEGLPAQAPASRKPRISDILGKRRGGGVHTPMDRLLEIVPNRYLLVNVIARRARDITNGLAEPLVEFDPVHDSPIDIAIAELLSGQITSDPPTTTYRQMMEEEQNIWSEVKIDENE
ncbi:MAG: DNA-directed RNA polymerase subunit omega [bacterium]